VTKANTRSLPRDIAVVGNGIVAWATAIALRRTLPGTCITIVGTPANDPALADHLPMVMAHALTMLDTIGVDEPTLVRTCNATHRIGDVFTNWAAGIFAITPDEEERSGAGVAFRLLAQANDAGCTLGALSPAHVLLASERFAPGTAEPQSPADAVGYALRLDTEPFFHRLRNIGLEIGIVQADGALIGVDRNDQEHAVVKGLRLDTGITLNPDWIIDASGSARLIADGATESWGEIIPGDTLLVWREPGEISLADHYCAHDWGWEASLPGGGNDPYVDRLVVYDTCITGDIPPSVYANSAINARHMKVRPERLLTPMNGNVVAIGEAAIAPGPLCGLSFSIALKQIAVLLELMPAAIPEPLLAAEYNRRVEGIAEEARDYLAALCSLSGCDGPFWNAARNAPRPDGLNDMLAQFGVHERLPIRDPVLISDASWIWLLTGTGHIPKQADPIAMSVGHTSANALLVQERHVIAALPATQPPYLEWLNQIRSEHP
jgi:tryptophan 7-halogenase